MSRVDQCYSMDPGLLVRRWRAGELREPEPVAEWAELLWRVRLDEERGVLLLRWADGRRRGGAVVLLDEGRRRAVCPGCERLRFRLFMPEETWTWMCRECHALDRPPPGYAELRRLYLREPATVRAMAENEEHPRCELARVVLRRPAPMKAWPPPHWFGAEPVAPTARRRRGRRAGPA